MYDQASELRKLVLQAMRQNTAMSGPPPHLIAVTAGIGGAGASTMAVNVSIALAELGSRVVVVDADPHQADLANLCGLSVPQSFGNVSMARRGSRSFQACGVRLAPATPVILARNGCFGSLNHLVGTLTLWSWTLARATPSSCDVHAGSPMMSCWSQPRKRIR